MNSKILNAHILIIDDKIENIEILQDFLEINGFSNIETSTDPRLTIDLFKTFQPDILLLDIQMPHLNGFQVMEQLKPLIPENVFFPILILTADVNDETKLKALSGGATDFLTKPFDLIEVNLRIKNLIKTRFLHQQLENQNSFLDSLVKERTKELEKTNIELFYAKENAEEMNKLKSYFLANMSHELRTPLISVLGFAELLQSNIKNPEHLEYINYILEGGHRLNYTLSGILEISKLEAENTTQKLLPCNLADEINARLDSWKNMAESKGLFLNWNLIKVVNAYIDTELFGKALFHLVHNGIKFTKKGGVSISLSQKSENDIEWAVISVIDTGVGIAKENFKTIFSAFRQSSEGLNRNYEGSGLGLAISKRIVELIHGKIQVESEVGKGSTFSIWLPAIQTQNQIQERVREKHKITEVNPPTNKEKGLPKILVVEDNASNRMFFNRCLTNSARIVEAEDGITGVTLASKEQFDLVLMDINLGMGIDGIEALHQIRKIPGYVRVPIVAVTAYSMPGDKDRFLKAGFGDYLSKPFTKDDLVNKVKLCIDYEGKNRN